MHVAIIGLGLIGGSVARALRAAPGGCWTVAAWTPSGEAPARALAAGMLDAAPGKLGDTLAGADLVVLAAPPTSCLALVDRLAGPEREGLAPGAVVTDVASTKARLVARADAAGLRFVGGHPMAGRETSGWQAADADLFRDRPWVVVPGALADEDDAARVDALARACGARPLRMDAATHDAAAAAISHLPLVLAVALVEAVAGGPGEAVPAGWPAASRLAASGWRDATRLARGDPAMGAGIAATNAGPLADGLRAVRARLDAWIALLGASGTADMPDEVELRVRLEAARDRLRDAP